MTLSYWLFQPQAWIILGIALVIADIFLGNTLFVLPFGVSAFILGTAIFADRHGFFGPAPVVEDWKHVLIIYAALSIAAIFLIRKVFQKKLAGKKDINDY